MLCICAYMGTKVNKNRKIQNSRHFPLPLFLWFNKCIKHREGNVMKYFGKAAADAYKELAKSYTKSQLKKNMALIKELLQTTRNKKGKKATLIQYCYDVVEEPKNISVREFDTIAVANCKGSANSGYLMKGVQATTGCGNVYKLKQGHYAADVNGQVYVLCGPLRNYQLPIIIG